MAPGPVTTAPGRDVCRVAIGYCKYFFYFNFYCCHGFNFHMGFFIDAMSQTVFSLSNNFSEMAMGGHQSNRVSPGCVHLWKMNGQNGFSRRDT